MSRLVTKKNLALPFLIVSFVLTGSILLFNAKAAGPFTTSEPESATITAPANKVTDTTASAGAAVRFGASMQEPKFEAGIVDNCKGVSSTTCNAAGYTQQATIWKDAGITSVRVWMGCNVDATTRWNTDLKYYAAQGVKPILVIHCGRTYADVQAAGFATWYPGFVKTMASFGVHNYELSNETNLNTHWHTTATSDTLCGANQATATDYATYVQDYVNWMKQAYTLAHASDSAAYVISGGVAYSTTRAYCIVPSYDYIAQMVRLGADRYMDGFGYHPYSPGTQAPLNAVNASINAVKKEDYSAVKAALGIVDTVPKRPMWITEVGYCIKDGGGCSSNGALTTTSDLERANSIKTLFDGLKAAGVRAPVNWYWNAGDGYGLERGGTAAGCSFGTTTMQAYSGHVLSPTLCAIKNYMNP